MVRTFHPIVMAVCAIVFSVCLAGCDSEECNDTCDDQEAAMPKSMELTVIFKLLPGKTASAPMWVTGRYFKAGTTGAESTAIKCQATPVNDSTTLQCSLGGIPTSSFVRFMVNVPMANGQSLPACGSADVNQCLGKVWAYLPDSQLELPIDGLVGDDQFAAKVAYQVTLPTPHSM